MVNISVNNLINLKNIKNIPNILNRILWNQNNAILKLSLANLQKNTDINSTENKAIKNKITQIFSNVPEQTCKTTINTIHKRQSKTESTQVADDSNATDNKTTNQGPRSLRAVYNYPRIPCHPTLIDTNETADTHPAPETPLAGR